MPTPARRIPECFLALALPAACVCGQVTAARPAGPSLPSVPGSSAAPAREVDQGLEDIGPLGTSLRAVDTRVDLRRPTGFDRVFEGADGAFFRRSGAVTATFSRSQYAMTRDGPVIQIPAGAVFRLGPALDWSQPSPADLADQTDARPDRRVGGPIRLEPIIRHAATPDDPRPTLVTDPSYRARRIGELMGGLPPTAEPPR